MAPIAPIKGKHYETQGYGLTTFAKNNPGYYRAWGGEHKGRDYGTNGKNLPALAVTNGKVVAAKKASGYGNLIEIEGVDGWRVMYAHLHTMTVKVGDVVSIGDELGLVGTTGASTGVHLHLGRRKWSVYRWIYEDPVVYLTAVIEKPKPMIGLYKANSVDEPNIYYVNETQKHHILDMETLTTLFGKKTWKLVDSEILKRIPEGEPFPSLAPRSSVKIPATFNYVMPNESQGYYPTCAVMSATRLLEWHHLKQTNTDKQFSVKQLYIESGGAGGGVGTGQFIKAMKTKGVIEEIHNRYPTTYNSKWVDQWRQDAKNAETQKRWYLEDEILITSKATKAEDWQKIKEALMEHGPLIVTVDAIGDWYEGGYPPNKKWSKLHQILLTGWDEDGWIGANSWPALSSGGSRVKLHHEYPFAWVYGFTGILKS